MAVETLIIIFNLLFCTYNLFYITLINRIFRVKNSKIKTVLYALIIGTSGSSMLVLFGSMSALGYFIMFLVYLMALLAYFKGKDIFMRIACVLTINIHIMSLRAIISAIASIITGQTIYELSMYGKTFWGILIATAMASLVIAYLFILTPQKFWDILSKKTPYTYAYVAITALGNIYMILNGFIYIQEIDYGWLAYHQILAASTWLSAMYVALIMLAGVSFLRKSKDEIEKDRIYKKIVENRSLMVLEVNCSKDSIVQILKLGEYEKAPEKSYSEYSKDYLKENIYEDDYEIAQYGESIGNFIQSYNRGEKELNYTYRMMIDDEARWIRSHTTITKDENNGDILAIITIIDDIHDRKIEEDKLKIEATKDSLTGISNKKETENQIEKHLKEHEYGVLFMIDIDNFKGINDNFGHAYGDAVICEISDIVTHIFRPSDVVGRIGGDEFMAFMKFRASEEQIIKKAEAICDKIRKEYRVGDVAVKISSSVGVAVVTEEYNTFNKLYLLADLAMYHCKMKSKDGFEIAKMEEVE